MAKDQLGQSFWHLCGPEPDYRWESFTAAVIQVVSELEIPHTTILHSVPMPIPHRRPLQYVLTGTREHVIREHSTWKPTTQLLASVTNLLEYRLQEQEKQVMSWSVIVPHYLAANEYPPAVEGLISALSRSTGYIFDTEDAVTGSREYLKKLEAEIAENPESEEQISELESRFDQFQQGLEARQELLGESGSIPSAEEIAGEFERFLAGTVDGRDSFCSQTDDDDGS